MSFTDSEWVSIKNPGINILCYFNEEAMHAKLGRLERRGHRQGESLKRVLPGAWSRDRNRVNKVDLA